MERTHTHIGFADESHYNKGRFPTLAVISLKKEDYEPVKKQVCTLLEESNVKELKWEKIKDAKYRFAAEKICKLVVELACRNTLRVDTLIWDIEDTRHKIKGRDDLQNLHRMYHHLLKNVLQRRWEDGAIWILHPDEHTGISFDSIQYFLEMKQGVLTPAERDLFSGNKPSLMWKQFYHMADIQTVKSCDEPLVQISDMFAGLASFSYQCFKKYKIWEEKNSSQPSFFNSFKEGEDQFSKSEKERFHILLFFNSECKRRKMRVSLNSHRGLITKDPKYALNFWFYQPQHELDKAPIKVRA